MTKRPIELSEIIDKALELAQSSSWETFSLQQLALSLDCTMADIRQFCRSKDDMAEAIFDRADDAMLQACSKVEFAALSGEQKLVECIMCWFESLAGYKPIIREILAYKLEPGHFHLQAHGITRISRTVQWFLEAANRERSGLSRISDEIAVTGAYLSAFSFFLLDASQNHANTRALLKRLIAKITQVENLIFYSGNSDLSASKKSPNPKPGK